MPAATNVSGVVRRYSLYGGSVLNAQVPRRKVGRASGLVRPGQASELFVSSGELLGKQGFSGAGAVGNAAALSPGVREKLQMLRVLQIRSPSLAHCHIFIARLVLAISPGCCLSLH